jgi:hypothetical protein
MRSRSNSRRLVVQDIEYRWRVRGDDGYISIGIWPTNGIGPYLQGNLRYHEHWIETGQGSWSSAGDQLIVTNRLIRRIIEHAIAAHGYHPSTPGKELNLQALDEVIYWDDAVRGQESR